jgi:hypothetical protein
VRQLEAEAFRRLSGTLAGLAEDVDEAEAA